jgi:hypothetical protein
MGCSLPSKFHFILTPTLIFLFFQEPFSWFSPHYNSAFNSKKDKSNYPKLGGEELSSLLDLTPPRGTVQLTICLASVQVFKFPSSSPHYSFPFPIDVPNLDWLSSLRRWTSVLVNHIEIVELTLLPFRSLNLPSCVLPYPLLIYFTNTVIPPYPWGTGSSTHLQYQNLQMFNSLT